MQSYATLGQVVGLSPASTHERVRKLRERGVIRRTTVDVDPAALGQDVLAFVDVESAAWVGDTVTRAAVAELPEVVEAHIVAGSASLLVKVRTGNTTQLQDVLRRIFAIPGVTGTRTTVVLETMFERPTDPVTG